MILRDIKNNKRRKIYGESDIDLEYILEMWENQKGLCAVSGIKMAFGFSDVEKDKYNRYVRKPFNASIDRIDNNKGYVKGNVCLVCSIINYFKGANDMELMYYVCEKIIENKKNLLIK